MAPPPRTLTFVAHACPAFLPAPRPQAAEAACSPHSEAWRAWRRSWWVVAGTGLESGNYWQAMHPSSVFALLRLMVWLDDVCLGPATADMRSATRSTSTTGTLQ